MVILTSNNEAALDRALERRLVDVIEFPRPGKEERELLWIEHLLEKLPLSADVDCSSLARLDLSGGEIKKAALAAAARALARGPDGGVVSHADLEAAARVSLKSEARIGFGRRGGDRGRGQDPDALLGSLPPPGLSASRSCRSSSAPQH